MGRKRLIITLWLPLILCAACCAAVVGAVYSVAADQMAETPSVEPLPVEQPQVETPTAEIPPVEPLPVEQPDEQETAAPIIANYDSQDYTGVWHQCEIMPAGCADRYWFKEDGTFIFANSEMDGASREIALAGNWEIDDWRESLILTVTSKLTREGGVPVPPYASYGSNYVLEGALTRFINLGEEDYETRTYSISTVCLTGPGKWQAEDLRRTVVIDGRQYWDFTDYEYDMFEYYEFCVANKDSFAYDEEKIRQSLVLGQIESRDSQGRIYTKYNYLSDDNCTLLSYFDMENGLMPLPKEEIIGKTITFPYGILLFSGTKQDVVLRPDDGERDFGFIKDQIENNLEKYDVIVAEIPPGQKLKLLDFFYRLDEDRYEIIPWLKLQTEVGSEGWVRTGDF